MNPTSVIGVTRRAAEMAVQSAARRSGQGLFAVRCGNGPGSRGSDPKMRRCFMTIPEAVRRVLRAATVGNGGEILVLDMGSPTRMIDMVEDMIALAGLRPHEDTRVQFVGLRPGEKLLKELSIHDELPVRSPHDKVIALRSERARGDSVSSELRARVAEH